MDPAPATLICLTLLLGIAIAVILVIRRPLGAVLTELCGTEARGLFWLRFFDATSLVTVFFFSLWLPPTPARGAEQVGFLDFLGMLRAGSAGLLLALGALAFGLFLYIARFEREEARRRRLASAADDV